MAVHFSLPYPLIKAGWLVSLALLLGACLPISEVAAPPTVTPTPTLQPLARAVDMEDDAIIIMTPSDPPSFNAYLNATGYEALIGELVYGALVEIGPDGEYYAELAANLPTLANGGLSEDGRMVTWRLRPGLYWSDGEPITSDDIRFTWQSLRDSGIWAEGFDLIEAIETPDELTAILYYRRFYPNYMIQFGGSGRGLLPAHHCGETDEMLFWDCNFEPVSSGPFMLGQWDRGLRMAFVPNPNYFIPDRPLASQLVIEYQRDPDIRRRNLSRSNAHLDLWPHGDVLQRMIDNFNVNIYQTRPARFVLRLVPNLSVPNTLDPDIPHPILSDVRVRRAIRYAVEVGRLNGRAFADRGTPVNSELFRFNCDLPRIEYNPSLTAALLDEAGWVFPDEEAEVRECRGCGTAPNGTPMILTSYIYTEFGEALEEAHELIAEMLAESGIILERRQVEGGQLWGPWQDGGIELHGEFDLNLWDDGYYGLDPTTYLANYFDPRAIPTRYNPIAGLNVSRYNNPELIELFDALNTPLPENRRRVLLCQLAIILYEDLPQMPLLAIPDFYATSPNLRGIEPHIYDTITWNAAVWQLDTVQ